MNKPTVLRNSAEKSIVLGIALKIYYEKGDWVSSSDFLDQLDKEYDAIHRARESRNGGQAIAKFKPVLYYSLLDSKRENGDNYFRINAAGRKFYEAYINNDEESMVEILIKAIEQGTFGSNNRAVPNSDSPLEPPKVFLLSSFILDGVSRYEYAFILENLHLGRLSQEEIFTRIKMARSTGESLPLSDYANNNYADDKGILLLVYAGLVVEEKGLRKIPAQYIVKYKSTLEGLTFLNPNYYPGALVESDDTEIEDDSEVSIQDEFKYYLTNCVKTARVTKGKYTLTESAVSTYLAFLNPLKLFDYKPEKWAHIKSMYDLTDSRRVATIAEELFEDPAFVKRDNEDNNGWRSGSIMYYTLFLRAREYFLSIVNVNKSKNMFSFFFDEQIATDYRRYVNAFMTKPFVLLAGISGTGKSRIVRKFAQATDDIDRFEKDSDRWDLHKPQNFELVQVKPNWHNSLEVVGYKSNMGSTPHYEFTPFVEFVAKAWMNPNTPFFLCLDEMNLAPVEQYFAEYLSAIESRSFDETTKQYETDPIIKPFDSFGKEVADDMINHLLGDKVFEQKHAIEERFRKKGLTLPQNFIVMGTVNMDETTFSFSRKVLDRAMSIEMNEVDFKNCLKPNPNDNPPVMVEDNNQLISRPIKSTSVINGNDCFDSTRTLLDGEEAKTVIDYLESINVLLDGTPFKLGYRACNEALLYARASKESSHGEKYMLQALDEFTLMKILSRIEGDKRSIGDLLERLQKVISEDYPKSNKKLREMAETLSSKQFVSYWN